MSSVTSSENHQNACSGKVRFDDITVAKKACQRSRRKHESVIAPYKCEHCHGWHLGQHLIGKTAFNKTVKRARKTRGMVIYG